jgi:hypothetical protein
MKAAGRLMAEGYNELPSAKWRGLGALFLKSAKGRGIFFNLPAADRWTF